MNKILVVDDSATSIFDIKSKLKRIDKDIEVCSALSFDEALEILNSEEIRIAFIDLQMPVKNGADLIMFMQEDPMLRKIPVMILTGTGEESLLKVSLESLVERYLHKPVEEDTLREIVNKYLKE